jgi:hypothetical protein
MVKLIRFLGQILTEFEIQSQIFFLLYLCVFKNYRKLGSSFKLSLSFLLLYSISSIFLLHLSSANYFFKIVIVTVAIASN